MSIQKSVYEIYGEVDYNPSCFDFTEQEARDKKLWRDNRAMPTQQELDDANVIVSSQEDAVAYKENRKADYDEQGLSFDSYVEMLIEDDTAGIAAFKSARNVIKGNNPKP